MPTEPKVRLHSRARIGQQCNLLHGLAPSWWAGREDSPVMPPEVQALAPQDGPQLQVARWERHQTVDLCESWSALVEAFFTDFDTGGRGGAHVYALEQPGAAGLDAFVDWLGLPAEVAHDGSGCGFALVRKKRLLHDQAPSGGFVGAETVFEDAATATDDHRERLAFFGRHGTHVVEGIRWGDVLGQVFVFDREAFAVVRESFPEEMREGAESGFFRGLTQLRDPERDVGYVRAAGRLWLASGAPELEPIARASADPVNQLERSIFSVIRSPERLAELHAIPAATAIGLSLAPLVEHLPGDAAATQSWRASESNGRFHLFGAASEPSFEPHAWPDYATIYQDFQPIVVTRACTARMSVKRPYVNLDTLEAEFPLYRDRVEDLLVVADVVVVKRRNIQLPGKRITIVCNRLECGSEGDTAPSLRMSDEAYEGFRLFARRMKGTLSVFRAGGGAHRTLADGEIVEAKDEGATHSAVVTGRIDDPIPADHFRVGKSWLADNVVEGLEYSLLATETLMEFASGDARRVARENAVWLSLLTSRDASRLGEEADPRLATLQLRAQSILLHHNAPRPPFVPPFSYQAYKPLIQASLAAIEHFETKKRQVEEDIAAELDAQERRAVELTMNQNLAAIGTFLTDQADALAKRERDTSAELAKLEDERRQTLAKLEKKLAAQLSALETSQQGFQQAAKNLEAAVDAAITEAMVWTVIELAVLVGTVAVNMSALADLTGKLAKTVKDTPEQFRKWVNVMQKLEAFFKVLKTFKDIYRTSSEMGGLVASEQGGLHDLVEAYAVRDGQSLTPTASDWSDFDIELAVITGDLPKEVNAEKLAFVAAGKRMSAAAKSWAATQSKIVQLGIEQKRLAWKKEVSDAHQARMDALSKTLRTRDLPEAERAEVDLFGMGTWFGAQSSAIRLNLARALREHDAAIRYYFLHVPEPITRYDLTSLLVAMIDREAAAIRGFSPAEVRPTDIERPITFQLPRVSVADLSSPQGLRFEIPLNHPAFQSLLRVRMLEVRVRMTNVRNPVTQLLYCRLVTLNNPFFDRGLGRRPLEFASVPFELSYVHDLENDTMAVGNRISTDVGENYNSMTPFTQWVLSVPPGGDNEGLDFLEPVTDVTLEIFVNASYSNRGVEKRMLKSAGPMARSNPCKSVPALMSSVSGKAVTNGWDVVCILDMARVNRLFAERYEVERQGGDQSLAHEIVLPQFVYTSDSEPLEEEENKADVQLTVGPPRIQLLGDGSIRASVFMDVLGGSIRRRRYERERDSPDQAWGPWEVTKDRTATVEPGQNAIRCDVNLTKLRGRANPALSIRPEDYRVVVQLGQGTFETSVAMDGPIAAIVTSELKKYFAAMEDVYDYCLGVARWDLPNTPAALQPKTFQFNTRVFEGSTPADPRGVLMLLIRTGSSASAEPSRNDVDLDNDQLLATGKTASLIIASRLVYEDLVLPVLRRAWASSSEGHEATISLTEPGQHEAFALQGHGSIFVTRTREKGLIPEMGGAWAEQVRDVAVPVGGLTASGDPAGLRIAWFENWDQEFVLYNNAGFGGVQVESSRFSLELEQTASLSVVEQGGRPILRVATVSVQPEITFEKSDIWRKIGQQIAHLPDLDGVAREAQTRIVAALPPVTLDLGSLSLFAVSNLLFPNAKVLRIERNGAHLPGDLWILGDVEDHYQPL